MIDWKRKLTSRKLWAALCALVTNVIIATGGNQETAVKVTAIIMAGATLVAYIIGEGMVDAANAGMVDFDEIEADPEIVKALENEPEEQEEENDG